MRGPGQESVAGLTHVIIAMADDEWMMGHRGSEWLARSPSLEEDLALSSISQDEMGHAKLLYDIAHDLGEPSADEQVYRRPEDGWRHAALTAAPLGDWAEWVVRRYLYEVFDGIRRRALERVPYPPLVAALHKMDREEAYHLAHARSLVRTLAYGGSESRAYLHDALTADWPLVPGLFAWGGPAEHAALFDAGDLAPSALQRPFAMQVERELGEWGVSWPGALTLPESGEARRHRGSEALAELLAEMRAVRSIAPVSDW